MENLISHFLDELSLHLEGYFNNSTSRVNVSHDAESIFGKGIWDVMDKKGHEDEAISMIMEMSGMVLCLVMMRFITGCDKKSGITLSFSLI